MFSNREIPKESKEESLGNYNQKVYKKMSAFEPSEELIKWEKFAKHACAAKEKI